MKDIMKDRGNRRGTIKECTYSGHPGGKARADRSTPTNQQRTSHRNHDLHQEKKSANEKKENKWCYAGFVVAVAAIEDLVAAGGSDLAPPSIVLTPTKKPT